MSRLASQRWHQWRKSRPRFPIAAWSYFQRYPGTLAEYETYAGANLTMVQAPLEQAANAKAAGLDLIVGGWQQLHRKDEHVWRRFVEFPAPDDRRVAAYGLEDEPHPNEFEGLRQVCEYIYRHDGRGAWLRARWFSVAMGVGQRRSTMRRTSRWLPDSRR